MNPPYCIALFLIQLALLLLQGSAWIASPVPHSHNSIQLPLFSTGLDDDETDAVAHAHRIMWKQHSRKRQSMQYRIIAAEGCEVMAKAMESVCSYFICTIDCV